MKKTQVNKKNGIRWFASVLLLMMSFGGTSFGLSNILFILAGIWFLPIRFLDQLKEKYVPKRGLRTLIATGLCVFACLAIPMDTADTPVVSVPTISTIETISGVYEEATDGTTIATENNTQAPADETTSTTMEPSKEPTSEPTTTPTTDPATSPATSPATEPTLENSTFSIHFIDVGQADAALVECDGHYMLIDGGNKADSNNIYSVLKKAGVQKLDIVVGTHAHEDHIGGLPGAFNYTTADLTLCPVTSYDSNAFEDFAKYSNKKGGGITVPKKGDTYSLGSATVTISGLNAADDPNDTSIILRIDYGETSFLFTGDAERAAEQAVINSGMNISATVLKVGHHGSDSSTSYLWLRNIMPEYAVISVGDDNSYGHPTDDVLSRLRDAEVKTFRTDLQGDIYCTSDGQTVTFSVSRNPDADVFEPGSTVQKQKETKPTTQPTETQEKDDGQDYVLNTNSKKFHYPSCGSAKKIKDSNRKEFHGTRDELIGMGYSPCGNCHP